MQNVRNAFHGMSFASSVSPRQTQSSSNYAKRDRRVMPVENQIANITADKRPCNSFTEEFEV